MVEISEIDTCHCCVPSSIIMWLVFQSRSETLGRNESCATCWPAWRMRRVLFPCSGIAWSDASESRCVCACIGGDRGACVFRGLEASPFMSTVLLSSSPFWPKSTSPEHVSLVKMITWLSLSTFLWIECLDEWGMWEITLEDEAWQLEGDVDGIDTWDFLPRPRYSWHSPDHVPAYLRFLITPPLWYSRHLTFDKLLHNACIICLRLHYYGVSAAWSYSP
jgi:hypothetical protein